MLQMRQPFVGQTHPTTVLLSVHKGASTFLAHDLARAMTRTFSGLEHVPFHQMLQRGTPVPVWGWASPGEEVTVRIDDQERQTTAAADGRCQLPQAGRGRGQGIDTRQRRPTRSHSDHARRCRWTQQ